MEVGSTASPPIVAETVTRPSHEPPDRVDGEPAGWRDRWRPSLLAGLWTWLAAAFGYTLVTYFSWLPFFQVTSARSGERPTSVVEALMKWQQWDTNWYVIIATQGYGWDAERSPAFFPLYPLLIRGVDQVNPGPTIAAALLVSAVSTLALLVLVHRLALDVLGRVAGADASRSVFYLLAFPTGFFLVAGYNESLFLALAVGSLYLMRHGRWWWAGALAGLASATRLAGVLLAAAFVVEYLRQRGAFERPLRRPRLGLDALAIALVPSGALAYAAFCAYRFGDVMAFSKAQALWLRDGYHPPWVSLKMAGGAVLRTGSLFDHGTIHNVLNVGAALGAITLLVLAVVGRWKLGVENLYLVVFAFLCVLVPLSTPIQTDYPLASMLRYVLECVPIFFVLAKLGRDERFNMVFLCGALMLQGVSLVTFLHGQFIA